MIGRLRIARALLFAAAIVSVCGAALGHQQEQTSVAPPSASAPTAPPSATSNSSPSVTPGAAATPLATAAKPSPSLAIAPSSGSAASAPVARQEDAGALLIEEEKRFATNCGRCHQSPHHFPPRMMATIIRHMRVRATLTDEDMRFIIHYMSE